ncbi:MAG: glycoside hydrolase family 11 protein [Chitinispirillaceae bacterium]|nr:glycoside hydrolase family 11 protein [Chitinispirillaceae bacterium]
MRLNYISPFFSAVFVLSVFAQWGAKEFETGATLSSNQTGTQGDYHVEYWKDGGSGSMTLGEGCNFSCQWGQVNNILFRKGVRPGTKDEVITYEADYKPQGNSYLSIYGWFENPLVEYYIIESWGSWKPPNDKRSKGTIETDSGTYDIYQNSRTGASIKGNSTFQQYWSVRRAKRTSGVITCANHFDAWEKAGMTIGKFYEVSFNVEAYQSSGGKADVIVAIGNDSIDIRTGTEYGRSGAFMVPVNRYTPSTFYNVLGQKITGLSGRVGLPGQHSVMFDASNRASGVYFSLPESR